MARLLQPSEDPSIYWGDVVTRVPTFSLLLFPYDSVSRDRRSRTRLVAYEAFYAKMAELYPDMPDAEENYRANFCAFMDKLLPSPWAKKDLVDLFTISMSSPVSTTVPMLLRVMDGPGSHARSFVFWAIHGNLQLNHDAIVAGVEQAITFLILHLDHGLNVDISFLVNELVSLLDKDKSV